MTTLFERSRRGWGVALYRLPGARHIYVKTPRAWFALDVRRSAFTVRAHLRGAA